MKLEQLQNLYNLYAKHEKAKWKVKKEATLLGHKLTFVFSIESYFRSGYNPDISLDDTIIPKASKKFFDELESTLGVDISDNDLVYELISELEDEINDELKPFIDLNLSTSVKNYVTGIFYNKNGNIKAWTTVVKDYKEPVVNEIRVVLSPSYTAVVKRTNNIIDVGCQRIPINIVRDIVTAWETLNPSK